MRETKRQTLGQARRLAKQADNSERQAEGYLAIIRAIEGLPETEVPKWMKDDEKRRYEALGDEFYEDADDLRGQIDPDLIDQL